MRKTRRAENLHLVVKIWASCFVAFSLVYSLVLLPQSRLIEGAEKDPEDREQTTEFTGRVGRDKTTMWLREQIEASTERLRDFVIDFEDSGEIVSDISHIANAIGLGSFGITDAGNESASPARMVEAMGEKYINVSFTGSYNEFATFLNALERRRPAVFVDTFGITRSADGASRHQVNMRLTILVGNSHVEMASGRAEDADSEEQTGGTTSDAMVIVFGAGVGPIKFGMSKEQIIGNFGEPDKIEGGGMGLNYGASKGVTMALAPGRGVSAIYCWSGKYRAASNFEGKTEAGIGMDATLKQILAAYGEPDRTTLRGTTTMILDYVGLRAQFVLRSDQLVNLRLFSPR